MRINTTQRSCIGVMKVTISSGETCRERVRAARFGQENRRSAEVSRIPPSSIEKNMTEFKIEDAKKISDKVIYDSNLSPRL